MRHRGRAPRLSCLRLTRAATARGCRRWCRVLVRCAYHGGQRSRPLVQSSESMRRMRRDPTRGTKAHGGNTEAPNQKRLGLRFGRTFPPSTFHTAVFAAFAYLFSADPSPACRAPPRPPPSNGWLDPHHGLRHDLEHPVSVAAGSYTTVLDPLVDRARALADEAGRDFHRHPLRDSRIGHLPSPSR